MVIEQLVELLPQVDLQNNKNEVFILEWKNQRNENNCLQFSQGVDFVFVTSGIMSRNCFVNLNVFALENIIFLFQSMCSHP